MINEKSGLLVHLESSSSVLLRDQIVSTFYSNVGLIEKKWYFSDNGGLCVCLPFLGITVNRVTLSIFSCSEWISRILRGGWFIHGRRLLGLGESVVALGQFTLWPWGQVNLSFTLHSQLPPTHTLSRKHASLRELLTIYSTRPWRRCLCVWVCLRACGWVFIFFCLTFPHVISELCSSEVHQTPQCLPQVPSSVDVHCVTSVWQHNFQMCVFSCVFIAGFV